MKKSILLFGCSLMTMYGFSQSDVSGPGIGHRRIAGRYVGWQPGIGSVAGPLDIRNDFNEPINLFTNGVQRMKLNGTFNIAGASQYSINGYTNANGVNTSGYLLLGQDWTTQGGNLKTLAYEKFKLNIS